MHITYVHHTRFPTERAHGIQVAEVCRAFLGLGHAVTLLAPTMGKDISDNVHRYYALPSDFRFVRLRHWNAQTSPLVPGALNFMVGMVLYRLALRAFLKHHRTDLFYARSASVISPLIRSGIPVILELHTLPTFFRRRFVRLCRHCHHIVCLTSPMCDELSSWGVPRNHITVEGDAVNIGFLSAIPPKKKALSDLGIREPAPFIVGYAGSLRTMGRGKGVEYLVDAIGILKEHGKSTLLVIAGGPEGEAEKLRTRCGGGTDCIILGQIERRRVLAVYAASDVLVYTAPRSNHPYFVRDTSPLKLFEYMAAEKPIICADLPPIRDILDERTASFYCPGDAASLASAILYVMENGQEANQRAHEARNHVQKHTWEQRMNRILSSLCR
jgi:glycosyltransferase involved in cell wall biosynthesis